MVNYVFSPLKDWWSSILEVNHVNFSDNKQVSSEQLSMKLMEVDVGVFEEITLKQQLWTSNLVFERFYSCTNFDLNLLFNFFQKRVTSTNSSTEKRWWILFWFLDSWFDCLYFAWHLLIPPSKRFWIGIGDLIVWTSYEQFTNSNCVKQLLWDGLRRWIRRFWVLERNKKLDFLFLHVTGWKERRNMCICWNSKWNCLEIYFKQRKVLFYEWKRNGNKVRVFCSLFFLLFFLTLLYHSFLLRISFTVIP